MYHAFKYFLIYLNLFILRSIAKQVIAIYINHSRPLIPVGIHFLIRAC